MEKSLIGLPLALLLMAAACSKSDTKTSRTQSLPVSGIPVKVTAAKIDQAWKSATNANPKCFVDLDSGAVYSVTTAPAHGPEIDLYWTTRPFYSDGMLCSPDESQPTIGADMQYVRDLKMNTWTQQNRTTMERSEEVTVTDFDAVQTVAQLLVQWQRDESFLTYEPFVASTADLSCIYVFETAQHKRGLIKFTSARFGANGYAQMQVKIEP